MMLENDRALRGGHVSLQFHIVDDSPLDARNQAWRMAEEQIGRDLVDRTVTAEPVRVADDEHNVYEVAVIARISEPDD